MPVFPLYSPILFRPPKFDAISHYKQKSFSSLWILFHYQFSLLFLLYQIAFSSWHKTVAVSLHSFHPTKISTRHGNNHQEQWGSRSGCWQRTPAYIRIMASGIPHSIWVGFRHSSKWFIWLQEALESLISLTGADLLYRLAAKNKRATYEKTNPVHRSSRKEVPPFTWLLEPATGIHFQERAIYLFTLVHEKESPSKMKNISRVWVTSWITP